MTQSNGSVLHLSSTCTIARDNAGRIHNEMRPLVPATVPPQPVLRVHLYDPQNRMTEFLFPQQKTYTVQMLNAPPKTDTVDDFASPSSDDQPVSQFARKEDLGRRTIAGLETHGVRVTQTLPAELSGTGAEVVVTNEYWYSEDLRINLIVRHNDPRTGSSAVTVTAVSRTEPDASLFSIPQDYQLSMPQNYQTAGAHAAAR